MLKLFLFALPVILTIYGVIDCVLTPESDMRWLPKVAWVMVILLLPGVGAAIWLLWGREDSGGTKTRGISRPGGRAGPARTKRMRAPDDNPDFLRQLRNSDREHEQVLRQWERELRRREGGSAGGHGGVEPTPGATPEASPPSTSPPTGPSTNPPPTPSTSPSTNPQTSGSPGGHDPTTPGSDPGQDPGPDDNGGPSDGPEADRPTDDGR